MIELLAGALGVIGLAALFYRHKANKWKDKAESWQRVATHATATANHHAQVNETLQERQVTSKERIKEAVQNAEIDDFSDFYSVDDQRLPDATGATTTPKTYGATSPGSTNASPD
jgi:Flp pilus assembly protein TadB